MKTRHDSVLLVVDVQVDFCPGGSLPVTDGDAIVPVVNRLAPGFARVVATQDWHPPGHVSFASSHRGKRPFEGVTTKDGEQMLWPDHCVQGTPGAGLHPRLDTRPFDLIVRKGRRPDLDSYSAFFENDRTTPTGLEFYIKGLGLDEVYLAGLALDVCVFYSAMDAVRLGLRTAIVEDACRGIDSPPGSLSARLEEMRRAGVRFAKASEIKGR